MSGKLTLISSASPSGVASVEFTSGIDSTYDEYVFYWVNVHFSLNAKSLHMNASTDGGSSYGVVATNNVFESEHQEDDSNAQVAYMSGYDQAQASSPDLYLTREVKSDNDSSTSGELHLFNPSSTSKVKHWISTGFVGPTSADRASTFYTAGFYNTTSAIDAIKFVPSSGNIDAGNIYMFGVS